MAKQILIALCNWLMFLTLPAWGGLIVMAVIVFESLSYGNLKRKTVGEVWLWEL